MLLSKYKKKIKYLYSRKKNNAGRNNTGHITVHHQGGGHKKAFRKIQFKENFQTGFVVNIEYDPNRSARIAKICFIKNMQKYYYYILAPQNLKIFDIIENSTKLSKIKEEGEITITKHLGSCYYIHEFNIGDYIYNIELIPNKGAQLVRSGGTSALILQKTFENITVKLPSGEFRIIPWNCKAFFGNLSNENHNKLIWKKAGRSRWLNIRPTVRGVAKNPIDHPHGGNTSGGCHPVTPWARLTKGQPTKSKKKINKNIIKIFKK